ncbi:arginine decarboxylase [Gloeomargarita lithophora Alchichica-D10]|uniref:Arginine decarboxylase n=1 Tax=Gloeomargarita lithophora Alchichica-D10 TaxID=1188229 RepID=A0A1J0AH16_9CYAN|nr:aminotransferase class I/II-fold pyridoxal phosphate-dependent enzyme [Gloeomargarita lithophora]APB35221.1 arginine decarboxylase [Gloeomargarita lithophora Alchichica-D10]
MPPLIAQLQKLAQGYQGFHTPGHQRGRGAPALLRQWWGETVFTADLAEIPGLDNLLQPEGILRQAQDRVAGIFGAEHTWFLVNGATAGVLASLLAVQREQGTVILPRQVHQSVIHGLILTGAKPIFITPEWDESQQVWGGIDPQKLRIILQEKINHKITALVLNSPSYKGVCGNVKECIEIAHKFQVPVIVDEAQGAHFPFHAQLPDSALNWGADVVIHSTHKVLTSLTQSALLHQQGNRIASERLSQCLRLVQSSSPSYLLLASLVATAEQMAHQGEALFTQLLTNAARLTTAINQLPGCRTLKINTSQPGFSTQDPTRLVIQTQGLGMTGFWLDELLHQRYQITAEFPDYGDLTFILSPGHTWAEMQILLDALQVISQNRQSQQLSLLPSLPPVTEGFLSPRDAFFAPQVALPWPEAAGRISAGTLSPYPPGIPVLIPGELITPAVVAYLTCIDQMGGQIVGCDGEQKIPVVSNW